MRRTGQYNSEIAVEEVLKALEYATKKEDRELVDPILQRLGLMRKNMSVLAEAVVRGPGSEAFFLEVLGAIRPFAFMLRTVYSFLNTHAAMAKRRASVFRVSSKRAKATLDFDLSNFPHELLRVLTEMTSLGSIVELRFPAAGDEAPGTWRESEGEAAWRALRPNWDGDFYDDGFHRALSYVHTVIPPNDEAGWKRAKEIVEPILDRLAAIVSVAEEIYPSIGDRFSEGYTTTHWTDGETRRIPHGHHEPMQHRVDREQAEVLLAQRLVFNRYSGEETLFDHLRHNISDLALALDVWFSGGVRSDRGDWLSKRLGTPLQLVQVDRYLELLEELARGYRQALDVVAPIGDNYQIHSAQERLLEFLLLPFWRHRWYLFELWTLVLVLEAAGEDFPVRLCCLKVDSSGVLEWILPGGSAKEPVATIGEKPVQVLCWVQRKTYHPGSKLGLEPDLRLTASAPGYHDLLIVENKDRLAGSPQDFGEILERYAGGTCAERVWLVNYASFKRAVHNLEGRWPTGRVRIASEFKPGARHVEELRRDVQTLLRTNFRTSLPKAEPEPTDYGIVVPMSLIGTEVKVVLRWGETPKDLDLHAWVFRKGGEHHICYEEKGSLTGPPAASLDLDCTTGRGLETITVATEGLMRLVVAVHNFSGEGPFIDATVTLEVQGVAIKLSPPQLDQFCRWWQVLVLELNKGITSTLAILGSMADEPPTAYVAPRTSS